MNFNNNDIEAAKKRAGEAAEERPDETDEALQMTEELGFKNGLPLIEPEDDYETPLVTGSSDELYNHYPQTSTELLFPEGGDFVRALAAHPRVNNHADFAKEAGVGLDDAKTATRVHNADFEEGEEYEDEEVDGIEMPDGTVYTDATTLVIASLIVDWGMSLEEVSLYLDMDVDDVQDHAALNGLVEKADRAEQYNGVRPVMENQPNEGNTVLRS